jgi:hypothetical protein
VVSRTVSLRALLTRTLLLGAVLPGPACGATDQVGADQPVRADPSRMAGASAAAEVTAGTAAAQAGAMGSSEAGKAGSSAGSAGAQQGAAGSPAASHAGTGAAGAPAADGGMGGSASAAGSNAGSAGAAAVGGTGGSGGSGGAQDPQCDMNGIWIARLTTFNRDSVFGSTQTASNWFYYEFAQTGRTVRVTKALDCGIQVSGSADVTINSATTKALLHPNDQTGRQGEFYLDGDHCTFKLARFYSTRGVPRSKYLPADTSSNPELSTIMPMLPTEQAQMGSEDWDGDNNPGVAFNVSGLGSRHVVQRDWNEFASDADHVIAPGSTEFSAGAHFDNQEQILAVTGAGGALLRAGSTPALDLRHRIKFRMLGRNASDPSAAQVRLPDDLDTCYKVQEALPHDKAMQ